MGTDQVTTEGWVLSGVAAAIALHFVCGWLYRLLWQFFKIAIGG